MGIEEEIGRRTHSGEVALAILCSLTYGKDVLFVTLH